MHSSGNWFAQVVSVTLFNLRSIPERKGAAIAAAFGIAGVVAVLVGVLAIAEGFRSAMTKTGSPDVAMVLRSGADNEMTSGFRREEVRVITDAPGIARGAGGSLASAELLVIIDLPKRSTMTAANVPLRGVQDAAYDVRGNVKIVEGRRFASGRNEIIVGVGAARSYAGLEVGKQIKLGPNFWDVVGIFSTDGGLADSEIWCDAPMLQTAYRRDDTFQSVSVKLESEGSFAAFKDSLTTNPQLNVKVARQTEFLAEQSTATTDLIKTVGFGIATLMALGALFGALNTMYSAVANRTREIATLRAIGFGAAPVVISVLAESVLLALAGGLAGGGIAYALFDGYQTSTMNFQTFSQVSFAFRVSGAVLLLAMVYAAVIGIVGGLLPAVRAARMPIASGLRES